MRGFLFRLWCLLNLSVAIFFPLPGYALSAYAITDLGILSHVGYDSYYGQAINAKGQVVGYAVTSSGQSRPFLYTNGAIVDLGYNGIAWGINSYGQITGWSQTSSGGFHAISYSYGSITDLGAPEGYNSYGFAIKDDGRVLSVAVGCVGNCGGVSFSGPGFSSDGFYANIIGPDALDEYPQACAKVPEGTYFSVNAKNQAAGCGFNGAHVSAIVNDGISTIFGFSPFGGHSAAFSINAVGDVTGSSQDFTGRVRAYIRTWPGNIIALGTLNGDVSSVGYGINADSQVTGYSRDAYGKRRAFLYTKGTMFDLNSVLPAGSGWELLEGRGINDSGQITGVGIHNGKTRGFLLSPVPAGTIFSPTALSLTEGAASGTYTVVLTSVPTADVTVLVIPDIQLSTSVAHLTFTPANWNAPQTITVQALQDGIFEGNHSGAIQHAVTSTDPRYNGLAASTVSVSINDTDILTVTVPFPPGTVWTQPELPVTGTAGPNNTVILTFTNVSTGEVRVSSAIAGAGGAWSLTLVGLADGIYELQPKANGVVGNKVTVFLDSHAPISTLSLTSSSGPTSSGWYTGQVSIAVTATDGVGGQGVSRNEYTLDGGPWVVFPGSGLSHSQDGAHTLCYRSVDAANNIEATRCLPVAIDSTAPVINPMFDASSNTLSLNAQDSVSGVVRIEISRDGGQAWTEQSGPVGFARDGNHTVQYRVRDNAGNLAAGQITVAVVTLPVITAPVDQTGIEAESKSFNLGSFSDIGADSPWSVDIDWGDGSAHILFSVTAAGALGALPHTYADNGMYTVTVKVADQAGNMSSKAFRIAVANIAPTAVFAAPTGPLAEGSTATLSLSNPADQSPIDVQAGFRYAFDCGDGVGYRAAGVGNGINCVALDNPNQVVRGMVLDKDGGSTEYSAVIAISNVPPTLGVVSGPSVPVPKETPVTISADFTDPGVLDAHTVTIDWDDGTTNGGLVSEFDGSGSISGTHSYAKPGHYVVTLTLTDKDGGIATATYKAIQVRGGPPAK